jgi:hypothetical protein
MLPLLTLIHNNARNTTTGYSPNQLLIGGDPEITPSVTTGTDNLATEMCADRLREWRQLATHALNKIAQTHKPSTPTFKVGQKVWLEAKNLGLPYGSMKLTPQRHGPFMITKEISPVVYWIALPPSWNIHPTFHALLLTPYVETIEHGANFSRSPPDVIDREEQYKVEAIRSH